MQATTTEATAPPELPSDFIDAEDAARLLGVGLRSIWRMVADGRIPQPARLSRKLVRFHRETLVQYMRRLAGPLPAVEATAPAVVKAAAVPTAAPSSTGGDDEEREVVRHSGALRRAVGCRLRVLSHHGRDAGLRKAFAALEALTDAAKQLNIADLFTEPIAALWDALPPARE